MNVLFWISAILLIWAIVKWLIWSDRHYTEKKAIREKARRKWEKAHPDWYREVGFMGREARDERQRAIDLLAANMEKELLK